jgi:hypothetical protein
MNYKIIALWVISTISGYSYCAMPSESVLRERLAATDFRYFNEKTNLSGKLGGSNKVPRGVNLSVDLAIAEFRRNMIESGTPKAAVDSMVYSLIGLKSELLELLLQEDPAGLEQLKKDGVYTPTK